MSAIDVIRRVETLGGQLFLDDGRLKVTAPEPLPETVMLEVSREKAAIMIALGKPLDDVVSAILGEIRPYLPPALKQLSESKLLVLVNWSIINAWNQGVRDLQRKGS